MKRFLLACLGLIVLVAGSLFLPGCSTGRQLAYGAKVFTSRTNPDYDRLEAARKNTDASAATKSPVPVRKQAILPAPVKPPAQPQLAAPAPSFPEPVSVPLQPTIRPMEVTAAPAPQVEPIGAIPRAESTEPAATPTPTTPLVETIQPMEPVIQPMEPAIQTTEPANSAEVPPIDAHPEPAPVVSSAPSIKAIAATDPPPAICPPSRWTQYRGPGSAGVIEDPSLTIPFPADGPTLRWKQPIGGGYGSFVFAGEAGDFVVTHEQRREEEAIVAYNLADGTERWMHSYPAKFTETMSGEGPRSTPCIHQRRVHALGATGELHALDLATGAVLWRKNVLAETAAENITYGLSASPVIIDGKLIVVGGSVLALDPATGDEHWRAASEKAAYVTPMPFDGAVLATTASRLVALDPVSGTPRWSHPWTVTLGLSCANPVDLGGGQLFVSGGYGKGAALLDIAGDQVTERWSNKRMKNKFNTSVHHNGYLYGLDEGILTCVEAATGKRMWKGGRYSYGQTLLVNDHLVVSTSDGELAIVKASPDSFQEVSKTPAIKGMTWNTPAIDNGVLLMRNAYEMACFEVR